MADIVSVREFNQNFRNFKSGQSVVVVDAVRKQIIAHIEFKPRPESIVQTIERIYNK